MPCIAGTLGVVALRWPLSSRDAPEFRRSPRARRQGEARIVDLRMPPQKPHGLPRKRGWAADATGEARLRGAGTQVRGPRRASATGWRRAATRVKEPGPSAVEDRLAGAASGPSRERRPLPRDRERPPTAPPRVSRRPHHCGGVPPPNRRGTPRGADGSAASNRASRARRQLSPAAKPGRAARLQARVPAGPRSGAAPCRLRAVRQCTPTAPLHRGQRFADPRQPIVTAGRDPPRARRREALLRAVERGRAAAAARGAGARPRFPATRSRPMDSTAPPVPRPGEVDMFGWRPALITGLLAPGWRS